MDDTRTRFVAWLRDAHAAEEQAMTMLTAQADRLENYPELAARLREHAVETEAQAASLERILQGLGESSSGFKDLAGKAMAAAQTAGGLFASDEVLKGAIASYAFEAMEAASYTVLITTARELGYDEAVAELERILEEELDMADWLMDHLPSVTATFLARDEADVQARR